MSSPCSKRPHMISMTPDRSHSRASSLTDNDIFLEPRAGRWRITVDDTDHTRVLISSVGRHQKIGVMCTVEGVARRHWLDILLDTGTVENITFEKTLHECGLDGLIERYTQPRKAIQRVTNFLRKIGIYTGHTQSHISTLNGKVPVIGKIKLKFKWLDQDDSFLVHQEFETTFRVAASRDKGDVPDWPFIMGMREMMTRNIGIIPPPAGHEEKDKSLENIGDIT
ncbi:hypothetical protein H2200_000068 [Cladophialophora chaetospira]|uniref:Uncharacterized protein n=1 Tax=Cladophialophora chaetospira TaxID=386627 RepID=A0AA38XMQ4_9EURO|nr:hypothetical protein H2200_000068 [Cladophialophora chaetospira]